MSLFAVDIEVDLVVVSVGGCGDEEDRGRVFDAVLDEFDGSDCTY